MTIYMMLAISAERFRAVCYPLSKRHVSCIDILNTFHLYIKTFLNDLYLSVV